MAINKIINVNDGSGREFTENTVAELKFDMKPEVGSFNAVTSDAVARAVAGASGEVPEVTESDNGKVLKAVYDEGGAAVEWGDAGGSVDQSYDPSSANAQSGVAVSEAVSGINAPPVPSVSDEGKILSVVVYGDTPSMEWGSVPNEVPSYTTSEDGKVLGVVDNAGTAELQWVNAGGGNQPLPAIPAYSIRFQFSDTSFDPTTPLAVTNGTWYPVDAGSGIWDFTYQNSDWTDLFVSKFVDTVMGNVYADIIGGNMSGVSTAIRLFKDCTNLRNVRIVSPWGDGNTGLDLSNMLEQSGATEIYLDLSGSNMPNGGPYFSYMAHESPSLRKFTLKNPGTYPQLDHILHDCFSLHEATIEGFSGIGNGEAMFTSDYNLTKITLTPTQASIIVGNSAESMFYRTGYAVETIEYPFDLAACNTVRGMFAQCTISQLPVLLNTGSVGNFSSFCEGATELRSIPYIDVASAYDVESMFSGCSKVQSGALDTYIRLSQLATPPSTTTDCFTNCGVNTASGKIELAKIPTSYGGLGYESASTASVTLSVNDLVVSDSVDVTSITVASGVTSGIVQWTVASTTTLPTVTDGTNPLKPSANNPASLTVGRTVQVSILNGTWVCAEFVDPYNPLGLPSNTIRCKFSSGYTPSMGDTQTLVDAQDNIWDIYKSSNDWTDLFNNNTDLLEVVGANTAGVTNMGSMFRYCSNLTSVSLFSTDRVTYMHSMFYNCSNLTSVPTFSTASCTNMERMVYNCKSLTSIPLLSTASCTTMDNMFAGCIKVESGALALYQQASQQTNPPTVYSNCFVECGRNAPSSAPIHTEMQQIPSSWGGTMAP